MVFLHVNIYVEENNSGWHTISILRDVKNEDYDNLVGKYYKNVYNNYKTDSDMEECFSIASYFEASYFANVYKTVGDTNKYEEMLKQKDESKEKMGELGPVKERIDSILE